MNWLGMTMAWIMVSLAISLTLAIFLPFYISIPLSIAIFIGIAYYIRRRAMARMGMGGGGFGGGMLGGGGINYICISCGHRFKGGACPRCGSKMRRADF